MALAAKNKKWLGYIVYVVLVTVALLYYLFPTRAVEEIVDNSVRRINPALGFKAARIGPWLPAGLRIDAGQIYLNGSSAPPVFKADTLYIKAQLLKLLRGDYSLDLSAAAYRGDIKGSFQSMADDGRGFAGELDFSDMDLADYGFLADRFQHKITGRISGDIEYSNDSADWAAATGKAHLRLNNGQLQFKAPIFGFSAIDMQNADMELDMRNRKLTVIRGEMSGAEVKAVINGYIQLQPDTKQSQVNMTGTLEPTAEFYKNYPEIRELLKSMKKRVKRGQYFFVIRGTLDAPEFTLL
jgi:type II secretion system protein N